MLTRSRSLGELAIEQGILAGLTPLRDVAGLGDNLPLLVCAVIVLFRVSFEPPGSLSLMATGRLRTRSKRLDRDLVCRGVLCTLSNRGARRGQPRSAAGRLPGHRGPRHPALDADLRRLLAGLVLWPSFAMRVSMARAKTGSTPCRRPN